MSWMKTNSCRNSASAFFVLDKMLDSIVSASGELDIPSRKGG